MLLSIQLIFANHNQCELYDMMMGNKLWPVKFPSAQKAKNQNKQKIIPKIFQNILSS